MIFRQSSLGQILFLTAWLVLSSSIADDSGVVEPIAQEYVTIETDLGKIRGLVKSARGGKPFEAFLGVPYAEPPIGDLRWEAPKPAKTWDGVLDATHMPSLCFQDFVNSPSEYHGSEDCLYLNVFTKIAQSPDEKASKKQTLVWFHGGAFIFGGIDYYGAEYVMEFDDVILVTVQYRLNAFGFMSTEDKAAPGNYGSLDQILALKWVQEHIRSFGGDPQEVTIFGMSAGGASVDYLTLSPLTRGLYKNSVALSGSALCWWASVPHPRNQALSLAEYFKCPTDQGGRAMVDCLKKVHGNKLMTAQKHLFFEWRSNLTEREPMNAFSPRPDPEREDPFLPYHPYHMLLNGDYNSHPHMTGYTDKEGIWRANQLIPDGSDANTEAWADFLHRYEEVAPLALGFNEGQVNPRDLQTVLDKVTEFYGLHEDMREAHLTEEKVGKFVDILSDSMFIYAIDEAVKLRAAHKDSIGPTYFYVNTYPGKMTLANMAHDGSYRRPTWDALKGASHGSDMMIIFPMFEHYPEMPEEDVKVSRKVIRMLIDFSKSDGNDVVKGWRPMDLKDPSYLLIDKEMTVQEGRPLEEERMKFWADLPSVYWRHSIGAPSHPKDEL